MKKNVELIIIILVFSSCSVMAEIKGTKHDLSASGIGTYKAAAETQICVFCHVPHGSSAADPLWNHASTVQSFTPYNQSVSLTLKSNPGQPDGASKLCLGCHDGTVAVGSTTSMGIISGLAANIQGSANIGTNLSGSHPVSFVYDNNLAVLNGELVNPSNLTGQVKLDKNYKLQCITCHDPHDNTNGKFLVKQNSAGALCMTCHDKTGWNSTIHKTSPAMAANGCSSCHTPHAASAVPLLKNNQTNLCYTCHSSSGPGPVDIKSLLLGTSTFIGAGSAGSYTTVNSHHDLSSSDQSYSGSKLACGNCHNSHAAKQRTNTAGMIETLIDPKDRATVWSGAGATDYRGSIINFCLSCHSGTFPNSVSNPNQSIAPSSQMINIGTSYQTDRHGNGSARPSANNPSTAVLAMACTDCHNPHGSHYNDQTWDSNLYSIIDIVDGTKYADNGAQSGPPYNWPYIAPTQSIGVSKNVRINPNKINTAGDANNLNSLCSACHSKTSGPGGVAHINSFSSCTSCHHHGNPITAGGL
ncbi:hypothetical protein HZC34_01570 [Candidatus Saganbacteria bacterium]|nr:hypothetical protein [Candidatus Saganbacteria bacterium]